MYILQTILGILLLIFFFSFSYMNSRPVNLIYYRFQSGNIPLYLVVIFSFLGGVLIAWINEILGRFRLHRVIWKQKRTIKEYEKKLEETDNIESSKTAEPEYDEYDAELVEDDEPPKPALPAE